MVAHALATETGVGIGLSAFGDQAGAKATIMPAGREAKRFKPPACNRKPPWKPTAHNPRPSVAKPPKAPQCAHRRI